MNRSTGIRLAALTAALTLELGLADAAPKITICHLSPDETGDAGTMLVSIHDWPDHESHGDRLGACDPALGTRPVQPRRTGMIDTGLTIQHGGGSAGDPAFEAVICGDRQGSDGRVIEVNEMGRITVQPAECVRD